MRRGRTVRTAALVAIPLLVAVLSLRAARMPWAAAADPCSTANVLSGSNFEIDVNGNLKVDGADPCIDWLADGTGSALRSGVLAKNDKPTGSSDDSFGQGTAENDANPTIVTGSIPPNKSDLKVFGVFTETSTAKFLELFWSRVQSPQGTTNMDFELNQKFCNPSATPTNCANNGAGVTPETPLRTAGDKLITYDLSKGGTVPTISIRTWNGSTWGSATVISGGANPLALGSVNTSAIAASGTGGIGSQDPFTFGEAAVSFNALFPPGSPCTTLGSAYLKSRSSDSFTAEIKDFIAPERVQISNCTTLTTTATDTVTIGSPISDTAHLSGATSDAGGTISFHLFSDDQCQNEVSTGLSPVPVNGNGDYNSGEFTPTKVGTYYWTASYSGDLNNAGVTTPCRDANESSVVKKAHPSVTTTATGTVTIGSPISDTAHLSGATSDAGGTISFHLFSDDQCQNEVSTGLSPVPVNGNGDYNSGEFTPTKVGTYYWTASYSGDASNVAVVTACGDANESSVVNKAQPSLTTTATASVTIDSPISDTAHLSGATSDAGGTISFHLFSDDQCQNEVSTGLSPVPVNGNGDYNSGEFTPTKVGTYYWTASYSGDASNVAVVTACGDANESSTVGKASSGISTGQEFFPQDTATIAAGAGGLPTGSVSFKLFGPDNPTCDANGPSPVYTETVDLTNGPSVSTSNTTFKVTAASASTYRWLVVYSGDATHDGATSACGTEQFTLSIVNG